MRKFAFVALLLAATSATTATAANVRYVSDQLIITLRTGQGNSFQILRALPSGTRLTVLEEDGEFSRVRTDKGTEGWVRNQYLVDQPIAEHRLAAAQQKAERLENDVRDLRERAAGLQAERDHLNGELNRSEATRSSLEQKVGELEKVAATPLRLREENRRMQSRIAELEQEVSRVGRLNDELHSTSQRDWFIAGAAVLGSGILVGLILPLMRRRRRSSGWGDL